MGRVNKTTEGVFVRITGLDNESSAYDKFIKMGEGIHSSKPLKDYTELYREQVTEMEEKLNMLSSLEELIMQRRSHENLSDIKLSLVREYIYARCNFFRRENEAKDIRVIVGKTDEDGKSVRKLFGNKNFMARAKTKLKEAMEVEINKNEASFIKTYKIKFK